MTLLLGYKSDNKLYKKAFIHKSYDNRYNNERLEFLGDAILSTIITETLFLATPKKEEGFLSQQRAAMVSRKHLNMVGKKIILKSEIKSNLTPIPLSVYGNTLEALIGAIYLDKGLDITSLFVKKHIYNSEFLKTMTDNDFKSRLLKYCQKEGLVLSYRVEKKGSLDHQQEFLANVFLNKEKIAQGKASTKKEAEQIAAKKAIEKLYYS